MIYRPGETTTPPTKAEAVDWFVHQAASKAFGDRLVELLTQEKPRYEAHLVQAAGMLGITPTAFLAHVSARVERGFYPERQLKSMGQPLLRLLTNGEKSPEVLELKADLSRELAALVTA